MIIDIGPNVMSIFWVLLSLFIVYWLVRSI